MRNLNVRKKLFISVLLTMAYFTFGGVNAWGALGDIVFMYNGSSIGTNMSVYSAKSGEHTYNRITMNLSASIGYNYSVSNFWLGSNNNVSNVNSSTLNSYPSIASALNILRTKQGVATLVFQRNLANIGKITYTHNEGRSGTRIALVYSKDNGSSYVQLGDWKDLATARGTTVSFEFSTIPIAQYAIVIDKNLSGSGDYVQSRVPVVTFYEGNSDIDYVITSTCDESLGEVEIVGNTILAKPDDCTEYGNPAYEVTSGTAKVHQEGDRFVADALADFTIRINFLPKPLYNVTLDDGRAIAQSDCLSAIDLPVVIPSEDCVKEGWRFTGWSEEEVTGAVSNITLIPAGKETYIPQKDIILYAVYEKTERIDVCYSLVTGLSQLEDGTYLLGTLIDNVYYFFDGLIGPNNQGTVVGGAFSSGSNSRNFESIPSGAVELTLESTSVENQYIFQIGSNYLGSSSSGSGGLEFGIVNTAPWTLTFSNNFITMRYSVLGKNAYLRGYKEYSGIVTFRTYASTSPSNEPVVLFKKILTPVISYNSNPDCTILEDITWKGSFSDDWNVDANWIPARIPTSETNVTIPARASYFPSLKDNGDVYQCDNITFEMGGQIGRIDLLSYNKAHVQLDFGVAGMTDYWHMLSMPIRNVLAGDLSFGRKPSVFIRKFDVDTSDDGSWMNGNWSDYKTSNIESFGAAEGFILWVNGTGYNSVNLAAVNNVLELPCFENTDESGTNIANPYHHYDVTEQKSTFDLFNSAGDVTGQEAPCNRNLVDDYRFIYEEQGTSGNVDCPVAFGNTNLALVGNPYLSSLDFDTFHSDNEDNIAESYQIWTGTGFSVYTKGIGYSGVVSVDQYIAPMQSFIVEKNETNQSSSLMFNVANVSVVAPRTSGSKLRVSENSVDKLNIIASNGNQSILTFIANRAGGSDEFGNKDSRKLLLGISDAPEVYTIKDSPEGKIGVGVNVLNTHEISIPIGLATKYSGNMTLTFNGMDNYNANIVFIDKEAGTSEEITRKTTYEYTFDYTPPQKENIVVANEDRFVVQFTPTVFAGLDKGNDVQIWAYSKDNIIFIVSNLLNPIKQVMVYNAQGALIYADKNVNAPDCIIYAPTISDVCIIKLITENGIKNIKLLKK